MPVRVRRTRRKVLPPLTKSVTRPTPYGNPFPVTGLAVKMLGRAAAHQDAVDKMREWLSLPEQAELVKTAKLKLKGFNLACWCHPDFPCHADLWLEICND